MEAEKLKNLSAKGTRTVLIAVGFKKKVNVTQLNDIASSPAYAIHSNNTYVNLAAFGERLKEAIANGRCLGDYQYFHSLNVKE